MQDKTTIPDNCLDAVCVYGAREHNLKNIDVIVPHRQLVVITGVSGSGKSSLVFDTIFAEAQRRYLETFSSYARQFIGKLHRPDVDDIIGLSPAVSIEQKTAGTNPRSTVGTVTEIYDLLRLLYARVSTAYSYHTGKPMITLTEHQMIERITERFRHQSVYILCPLVRGRKGHYRELFEQWYRRGFLRMRVDGELIDITPQLKLDRYKIHDVDLFIDGLRVESQSQQRLKKSVATALQYGKGQFIVVQKETGDTAYFSSNLMCEDTGLSYPKPEPNMFSFNSPYGSCPKCNGLGEIVVVDKSKVFPDPSISIQEGAIAPIGKLKTNLIALQIKALSQKLHFSLDEPIGSLPDDIIDVLLYGYSEPFYVFNEVTGVRSATPLLYEGIVSFVQSQLDDDSPASLRRWAEQFMSRRVCPECGGARLRKESLWFRIGQSNIADVSQLQLDAFYGWIGEIHKFLQAHQQIIAAPIVREIQRKTEFLLDVGLHYLTLHRPAMTLSGGEAQRIRLATQIASNLTDVLYVLDEPSIGLHYRDNKKLIKALQQLRDKGNTVIVVEHDRDMMLAADYIIDLGPGAGQEGGRVVAQGTPDQLKQCQSLTCKYLSGQYQIPLPSVRRIPKDKKLIIKGCKGNNLKNVTIEIPVGVFIAVTGVSGSGKSSLINHTLYPAIHNALYKTNRLSLPYDRIENVEVFDKVIAVDQQPIGRTPRSNPATYTKLFDHIRALFAQVPLSKIRGYKPGHFSFNVKGGRCEQCKGAGVETIEMKFLPDVQVICTACQGKRYAREILDVRYKGKNIYDVLQLTVRQAKDFFSEQPAMLQILQTLDSVGLGYITLGQSATTLSGGESQRLKLAAELAKRSTGKTLYILDEPTTGLHFHDIHVLLKILHQLVDKGNTVIVIEHHPDVIKTADYIIDLGPEGGQAGGYIVSTGTPEDVAFNAKSYTGLMLREILCVSREAMFSN